MSKLIVFVIKSFVILHLITEYVAVSSIVVMDFNHIVHSQP